MRNCELIRTFYHNCQVRIEVKNFHLFYLMCLGVRGVCRGVGRGTCNFVFKLIPIFLFPCPSDPPLPVLVSDLFTSISLCLPMSITSGSRSVIGPWY